MRFRNIGKWLLGALVTAGISGIVVGAEIGDLNITDGSNTARFPEGMAAGSVNDQARALECLLARGLKDTIDGVLTTTNGSTVTALQFTPNRTLTALYTGLTFKVLFHTDVGENATLNVASLGAGNLVWPDGGRVEQAEIEQRAVMNVSYSDGRWFLQAQRVMGGATFMAGYISPATLTGSQNNWEPTGFANANTIFITVATGGINITGLTGGSDGRIVTLRNMNRNDSH